MFALLFQRILHGRIIPVLYEIINQISFHPYILAHSSKTGNYRSAFLIVTIFIAFSFLLIPTLLIHRFFVPQWSWIELIYFAVTTNYLIGFGDLMPCSDLKGQSRSNCSIYMTSKNSLFEIECIRND